MAKLSYEDWRDTYFPIMDRDTNDVMLFDFTGTWGELLEFIPSENIWTLVEVGEDEEGHSIEVLEAGRHLVDRMGVVVCKVAWEDKNLEAEW